LRAVDPRREEPGIVPKYRFAPATYDLFLAGGAAAERVEFDDCNPKAAAHDEQLINSRVRQHVPEPAWPEAEWIRYLTMLDDLIMGRENSGLR
jgi:hypothetical protein